MKKIAALLLLLFVSAHAQLLYVQDDAYVTNSWRHLQWIAQQRGATTGLTFATVKAGDTLFSKIYSTMPMMFAFVTSADTGATDSIKVQVDLMQSAYKDTTRMVVVKTLTWNTSGTYNQAFVNSAGYWYCDLGYTDFPGLAYFQLRVIGMTGNKVVKGVSFKFDMNGHAAGY
jgi:hypothetical protein